MKTKNLLPAILLTVFVLQACRNTENKTNDGMADSSLAQTMTDTTAISRGEGFKVFLEKAAIAGTIEVQVGKVAIEKASNPKVKKFASQMVKDHTKINDELKKLANGKNITLPDSVPIADQNHLKEMAQLSGSAFDKHYMDMMVNDHIKTLDLFKSATTSGDVEIRKFAAKALRKIEEHYKTATDLNFSIK